MSPRTTKKLPRKSITLPDDDDAVVRLSTVLGVYPVSKTAWRDGVRSGRFPRPVKLGPRAIGWRAGQIRELLAGLEDVR